MQRTTDAKFAAEKFRVAFGGDHDFSSLVKRRDVVVLTNDVGISVFCRQAPGLYTFVLGASPDARGKPAKDMINDSFSWMFVNTDAYVLRSEIDKTNAASLAIAPHTLGYRLEDPGPDAPAKLFSTTLARWAKAYGMEKALSEIRAAGQTVKADKLEAAAKAAGVL